MGNFLTSPKALFMVSIAFSPFSSLIAVPLTLSCPQQDIPFNVESAQTPEEQAKGLMFRETLAEDGGMIFLYSSPQPIAMWMKNTHLPLDMIFANEDGTILALHENTIPHSLDKIGPVEETSQVLEVKGGSIQKHGITDACQLKLNR